MLGEAFDLLSFGRMSLGEFHNITVEVCACVSYGGTLLSSAVSSVYVTMMFPKRNININVFISAYI